MRQEIEQMKEVSERVNQSNHVQLMQQNINSQEDIVEEINQKEELIIEMKRSIEELEGELDEKKNIVH